MLTPEKLEHFFLSLNYDYNQVAEGVWLVNADHDDSTNVVISVAENLVLFRLKLAEVPSGADAAFLKKLLALNMKLDHGAVAIDGGDLVLVDSVEGAGIHADEIHASVMALENGAQMIYNAIRKG
ncbi:MAG TPA: YbjN domain-containing protein [bacterium]|nr:YbjN domain-containing protein [bacterium]